MHNRFIRYINDNYDAIKSSFEAFCRNKMYRWDEDIFQDTILKCYSTIERNGGLKDGSEKGMKDYFFRSFKQNLQREAQYSRNANRDWNVTEVMPMYEDWYNANKISSVEKLKQDLWKDFSCLYIMHKVEEHFSPTHFNLFRLKYLIPNMTYKKLYETTKVKGCRKMVVDVKQWVRDNVTKEEIKAAYNKLYGDITNE